VPYSYVSRTSLKDRVADSLTDDDTLYRAVLEAASSEIDAICNRTFQPHTATRSYRAHNATTLVLPDDLLSVTSLKTYKTSSRDSQDTWSASDYDLLPYNAAGQREPYTMVEATPDGLYVFPSFAKGVEIVGVWGWWLDTLSVTTLNGAISSTTATSVTVATATASLVEPLMTILVDSEQMYVTAVSGAVLTVERGVNGTTAATHLTAAAVSVYRYPSAIVEATAIQSARLYRRKDAPFGVIGSPEFGQTATIARVDPDVKMLTRRYMRHQFAAVGV
jgi:hypothetical protein